MTSHEDKSDIVNPKLEVEQASNSGSRYIFRGDDEYRGGSLGFEIGSKQIEEAISKRLGSMLVKKKVIRLANIYLSRKE